jgi:hypothetical protein
MSGLQGISHLKDFEQHLAKQGFEPLLGEFRVRFIPQRPDAFTTFPFSVMKAPSTESEYSFEHGVDHCGYGGVAPILYVGGPVTAQDFVERSDLATMRGVSISQHGLTKGTKWKDLNLRFLFATLPKIEYLRVLFDDPICLDDLGHQPLLRHITVDCPKVRGTLKGEMPDLKTAHVRWSDECTASIAAPGLEKLTLIRPLFQDLSPLAHLTSLRALDIHYARNFQSLLGLPRLSALAHLGLHDCPNLTDLSSIEQQSGPHQVVIGGCLRFADACGVLGLGALAKLCIYAGERGPREVSLPRAIASRPVELDVRGLASIWV